MGPESSLQPVCVSWPSPRGVDRCSWVAPSPVSAASFSAQPSLQWAIAFLYERVSVVFYSPGQ